MPDRFEQHARNVTLLTLLSRVTGLARDAALSRVFGLGPLADAFWFAFMIPNLFRRLFGEGALSAAFLPAYSKFAHDEPRIARQLATLTISLLIIVLGGLTLIGEIVLLVISTRSNHDHTALGLMMIMLPYMPMVCLVAILGAMLQVHGRFGPTASVPIVLNLCLVASTAGLAWLFRDPGRHVDHMMVVAASVILAGVLQVAWSLWSLRHFQWWAGSLRKCSEAVAPMKKVLVQFLPMFIGLGVLQLNTFVDGLIASYPTTIGPTIFGYPFPLDQGSLTALSNAQRLYEFPLGVFGIAVATAIFPALARAASDQQSFTEILRRGLRLVMYIGLPASVGLVLVRVPLTAAILQGKNFTPADTQRVAFVLLGYAPAIWAYSMIHTLTRAFYARGDSVTPVKVALWMVTLNLALNLTLIWTPLKEAAFAWSTAICAVVQVIVLMRFTRRYAVDLVDRDVLASWARTLMVTVLMASAVLGADALLTPGSSLAGTWRWAVIELGILVGVGAVVVAASSIALRMPEFAWALGRP